METRLIVFMTIFFVSGSDTKKLNETDNILKLIKDAGYMGEAHRVVTEDGYILKVHRVLPKRESTSKPVFLMHGILATAADFLITGPKIALAYLLADNGYDVWLGNARGSKHSTRHKKYSADSKEYWSFSWHEIGYYDLPAMVDYMLKGTKQSKAFYVGHSQGTTTFFVMLSTRPEYNEKIAEAHLLAPSAFRKRKLELPTALFVKSLIKFWETSGKKYLDLTKYLKIGDKLAKALCRENDKIALSKCKKLISRAIGHGQKKIRVDIKILPSLSEYLSSRVSVMQFTHYYQNLIGDDFRLFDYKNKNLMRYNSKSPPEYQLSNVIAPLHLYHAPQDLFITTKGVEFLRKKLPNVKQFRLMNDWNHIDFVYSKSRILYSSIVQSFNSSL